MHTFYLIKEYNNANGPIQMGSQNLKQTVQNITI